MRDDLSPAEIRIAAIWQELLGADRIDGDSEFFVLGGNDTLAGEMARRVADEFGTEVHLSSISRPMTVSAISGYLEQQAFERARLLFEASLGSVGDATAGWQVPEEPAMAAAAAGDGPLPLSFAQQRLWFLDQLDPGRAEYLIPIGLRVRGPLDVGALETALTAVVARHDSLRTRFTADDDGHPRQTVDAPRPLPLAVRDLRHLADPDAREESARHIIDTDAFQPVDLATGPLIRAFLIRLTDDEAILAVTVHHIVFDGWSAGVLAREVSALYTAARTAAGGDPLPELPLQYADFAVWQRDWLTGEVLAEQLAYWSQRLTGLEPLELPTDHRRPARRSGSGDSFVFTIPAALADRARGTATAHGASLFMTLLSVFQLLLSKYSGQQDIAVGTPIAGRNRVEIEDMIGFFVNTLVMRTDLSGDPTFTELLERAKDTALGAYDHQDLPFERLVEELAPERDLSRNPLVQTMFVVQNMPDADGWDLPGLTVEPVTVQAQDAKFDFTFYVTEAADRSFEGMIVYSTDLFERATMERLAGHFQTLLDAVTTDPAARLSAAGMLTPAERRQILVDWNGATTDGPDDVTVHQLFQEQAALRPDAPAVSCGAGALSYRELNERANRLAHHLRSRGVGRDSLVGVCLDRGTDMICALLGILKAGAAYLPLDPDYPTDRLTYMVEDSATPLVITQSAHVHRLPAATPRLLLDQEGPAALAAQPVTDPPAATADSLAYTIYTSGSTGKPKGVQIEHGALRARMRETRRQLDLTPDDRVLQFASIAFDSSVGQMFAALTCGACLVLRDDRWAPDTLAASLRDAAVTVAWLTPSAFAALTAQLDGPDALGPRLRLVRLGGEALQHEQVRQWFAHSRVPLVNGYGPTEAAQEATTARIEGTPDFVPVGRPVANARVFVVDRHGRPVPVGIPGEIWISCPGLARGYLNQPQLTAEKFAHRDVDGTLRRVYRTGDLVKWRSDGQLEFVGRADNQIKLRGYRIELGEIEATLLAHDALASATVIVREDTPGDRRLVAYTVAAHGTAPTAGELRAHLRRDLPDHMIPAAFVALDRLPLTPNGKTDRRALPAPDNLRPDLESAYTAPRTPAEEAVTAIWSDILGVAAIGVDDNFFELGGHSLLATQVTSRIRKALGVDLPVRTLFTAPTPARLAAAVSATGVSDAARLAPAARDGGPLPLSFAQQRLWFLDQLEPGRAEYLVPVALRVTGPLDTAALDAALTALVARHEVLRTRFTAGHDGEPAQLVDAPAPVTAVRHDLSHLHPDARQAAARDFVDADIRRPVDLAAGPVLRAALLRLDDDDHVLTVTVHHIAYDGWSAGILSRELAALYTAAATGAGTADALPALPVQYADYAVWQRDWLSGEVLDAQLGYWRERLDRLEPLELPTDHRRPAERSGHGEIVHFTVPVDVTAGLKAAAAGQGASLFMALLSVFQLLLSKYSGQQDIAVGTPIAGRNRAEIEELVGFFVNTLVMRTDLSGDPTFTELLERVKETALGAYDHQDLPFERLVEELAPERDLSRNPLFQTLFILQNVPDLNTWRLPGLIVEPVTTARHDAKFDLGMYLVEESDGTLGGAIVYTTDLFEDATVRALAGHFQNLLAAVTARPQAALSELSPLAPAERHRILVRWNDTAASRPDTATLHSLFEEQARRTPDAPALSCGPDTWTYRQLDERANQLAHHLRDLGVGPDVPVGVCLERGPEMVRALLGVLKAGGAYVPLDPEHPADRLGYLVQDSATPLIVTHSGHLDRLPPGTTRLALDRDAAALAGRPTTAPAPTAGPGDLCYLIYTSGSTGRPKGVRIEHRGVVNYLSGMQDEFPLKAGEGFLQATPLSFDVSAYEIFWPLWRGANVVLVPGADRLDMASVSRLMRDHHVVGLHFVPSLLDLFVAEARPEDCADLRYAFCSGEPLQAALVQRFLDRLPGDLVNLYGATEVSVDTTFWRARRDDPAGRVLAGRPMSNQTVYVLDPAGAPVPAGVLGEVYLGGASVGRGYHNRPELTAERFLPDPFAGGEARMYRTGDLARFTADGDLDLLGRVDRQVKLRGVRIELGEIEAALLDHPDVGTCAVVVREDTPGDKRLAAYCTAAPGRVLDPAALRVWTGERLPRAMTPSVFTVLDALPLNSNGKVDHKALPVPDGDGVDGGGEYTAPRDEIETLLAEIMADVLGVERVGVHDGFFALGGHSLLATRLVNRIESATGVRVSLRTLFLQPSVVGIKGQLIELLASEELPS
ncbi:non-ribosomal peptide synthetase [Streptantibioticus silvisoli]|uniref:Amino acid adenylation domain-containing protein n=1 Tax=Streptantibioticus silvisoli TaxID=2705255 RepID=A0ABT6VUU3_9ACTN|nr:non-ribosomal peptide synthetase [Streptantibioticus silvisoli]MDI5962214.1 amino acid adenylation domain-containing protein [Streptantibioticus silvisoli]